MNRRLMQVAALIAVLVMALPAAAQIIRGRVADAAAAQAAQDVRERLPDGAALAVFYNGGHPEMGKTAIAEIWNEPGVKEFFEPVWEAIRQEVKKRCDAADAPDMIALEPVLRTQIAVGLYPPPDTRRLDLVAVVNAGPEGSPVRNAVKKAFDLIQGDNVTVRGQTFAMVKGYTDIKDAPLFGFVDQVFFLGSQSSLDRALDPQVPRLTASPLYKEMAGQTDLGKEVLGVVADYDMVQKFFPEKVADVNRFLRVAGLDRMKGAALTWTPKGRGMMTTLYVSTPTDSGVVAALVAKPVDPAILKMVPKNAHAMFAFNLDAGKVYDGILAAIGAASPEELEQAKSAVAEFEAQLGVKLREEFLAALDEGTAVVVQEGGMFMPNITLVQKVKDAVKVDESLGKLLTAGGALAGQALSGMFPHGAMPPGQPTGLRSVTYGGAIISYVDMAIVSPSYAFKDGYLIVTASPVEMKDFLDGMGKGSILENADWTAVRAELPLAAPQYLYYGDYKSAMKKVYYLLPAVAAAVNSIAAVPVKVDPGKLPGAERFASHLFGAAAACQFTPDGFKACIFSPMGTSAPMTMGSLSMPWMSMMPALMWSSHRQMMPPEPLPVEPLPVEPPNPL